MGGTTQTPKGQRSERFNASDEAVSPVLGVVLMVGLTVVLAATVYTLVSSLNGPVNQPPGIEFQHIEEGTVMVQGTEEGVPWADLEVQGCTTTPATGNVTAGQLLQGCTGRVTVSHTPTGKVLWTKEV